MGMFLVFILKSTICLTVFYLFYKLLLSRDTFHRFNRVALLSIVCFSMLIPLCEVSLKKPIIMQPPVLEQESILVMSSITESSEAGRPMLSPLWARVWLLVYAGGGLLFSGWFIFSCVRMFRLMRRGVRSRYKGIWLIITPEPVVSFSWMHYVVISGEDWVESGEDILAHEMAHIKNNHSLDLLLAEACVLLHWFNPAAWLLRQELQHIHEYEADESVIRKGIDAKRYQLLLIKKAVGTQRFTSVANSFNHSSLKKRIAMMLKRKSHPWARLKYLYVLPLAACAIAAFARPEISRELEKISSVKLSEFIADMQVPPDTILIKEHPLALEEDIIEENIIEENIIEEVIFEEDIIEEVVFEEAIEINEDIDVIIDTAIIAKVRTELEKAGPEIEKAMEYVHSGEIQKAIREGMEKAGPEIEKAVEYIHSGEMQKAIREGMEKAGPEIEKTMEYIHSGEIQKTIREGMEKAGPEIEKAMEYVRSGEMQKAIHEGIEKAKVQMEKDAIKMEKDKAKMEKDLIKMEKDAIEMEKAMKRDSLDLSAIKGNLLILLDEKEITKEEMNKIDPALIESISVLKDGPKVVEWYGEKAADGVIIIELKKGEQQK
ncbi:MAG: hypothetical protein LBS88_07880 [Tannerellaceae bacterium]|jgi:hypothetical protein|nr:hypothetical protein [Tannerellaceae bacterium]